MPIDHSLKFVVWSLTWLVAAIHLTLRADCLPAPPNLVAWWRMDEASTEVAKDVLGLSPASLTNTTSIPGMVGLARRCVPGPGIDANFVASGSGILDISGNQITLEAWVKLDSNPDSTQRFTGSIGKLGFPDRQCYELTFESGNHIGLPPNQWQLEYVLTRQDGTRVHNQGTGVIVLADDNFHHVAMTYDGGMVRLYTDGVLRSATPFSGSLRSDPVEPFRIAGVTPFAVDELAAYARALSAVEIQGVYQAGSAGKCPLGCTPVPIDLVSWYPGEGSFADVAGTNSPSQVTGLPQFLPAEVGLGIEFDGSSGLAISNSPTLDFGSTASFTIETWVRIDAVPAADSLLVDKRQPGGGLGYLVGLEGLNNGADARRFYCVFQDGAHNIQAQTTPVADGGFHHLAVVLDRVAGLAVIYLDGVVQQSSPAGSLGSVSNAGRFFIGQRSLDVPGSSAVPFNGVIDELSVYSQALSAAEVQAIYHAGSAGKCARYAVPWFKMAGGGGSGSDGVHTLVGTVGQTDASGPQTNSQFSLVGGFWALPVAVQVSGAPTLKIFAASPGFATLSWTPNTPGFVLQEAPSLSPANWTNSLSGPTNPITVPAALPAKFYRLSKP